MDQVQVKMMINYLFNNTIITGSFCHRSNKIRILIVLLNFIDNKTNMLKLSHDSLDQQKELFQRAQSGHPSPFLPQQHLHNQNQIYKNFYKQQLDDLVQQKAQQRRILKEREQKERNMYNQRITQTIQAEKMKDLSYKNYYHMLLSNQNNMLKHYVSPFDEKSNEKDKLIHQGVEEEKIKREAQHDQEQRRIEESKKVYREYLAEQINQKYNRSAVDSTYKIRENEEYKKAAYSPQQLAKIQRERKVMEMQRYKQDLDKTNNSVRRQRSMTNPNTYIKNDFNVQQIEDRHNPMINPLPYTMQNPYILREMKRKSALQEDQMNGGKNY